MRYAHHGLHSCVLFGFRPIPAQAALRFLHFVRHKVFIHGTRLYKVLPFPERADFFSGTMASADFSQFVVTTYLLARLRDLPR